MGFVVNSYKDRTEWLAHRNGIGASEAGAVVGHGFKTPLELWRIKVGEIEPEDLSDNPRVQFGNDIEEPLRSIFRVMHPEYELGFTPYTILRRDDKNTFMFSTPDGWLKERETGRRGLYESKSATCLSRADWDAWKEKIPTGYYCQLLHSMYVGDFDFAVLFAILLNKDADAEIRAYKFERQNAEQDIEWLVSEEVKFWNCVETGNVLPLITNTRITF